MLNGVGGATVARAKESISQAEFLDWIEYRERRGSLNLGMRLEAGFSLLAVSINRGLGGHAKIEDFMPHMDDPEATIGDVMKMLTGGK